MVGIWLEATKEIEMQDDQEKPRLDEIEKQRKEDYKAYHERDVDEGWPYSDEAGTETERLNGNRPYHDEDLAPVETAQPGMHVEDIPAEIEELVDENSDLDEPSDPKRSD